MKGFGKGWQSGNEKGMIWKGFGKGNPAMRNGKGEDHWKEEPPDDWTRTSYRRRSLANWITDPETSARTTATTAVATKLHRITGRLCSSAIFPPAVARQRPIRSRPRVTEQMKA